MMTDSTRAAMAAESDEGAAAGDTPASARKKKKKRKGVKKGELSRRRAVQLVVDELGAVATSGQVRDEVLKRYGLELDPNVASQYRSTYLKSLREGGPRASDKVGAPSGKRLGRPPKAAAAAAAAPVSAEPTIEEIMEVKALYERIGAKRFDSVLALIGAR